MVQVDRGNRDDPNDLKGLYVRNSTGQMISLDNLVTFEEATSPATIYHFNRYKAATISSGLAPGKTIGDGIAAMEGISKKLLDPTFATALSGSSRDFKESSSNTSFALFLALGLIFLVLAAQFESFVDPFIIMVTVPLAIAGALLSLWVFGHTLNIFSQIGMIMLIGLVTKNGILIVEFANQNLLKGMGKMEAAIYASIPKFLEEANKNPAFQGVDADLKFNKPELRINVDRLKASELGVSVQDVSQTLQLALSNRRLGYFTK